MVDPDYAITRVRGPARAFSRIVGLVAAVGATFLPVGCGYRPVGPGRLPAGLECVGVGRIENGAAESGLEVILSQVLEEALARRGLLCGQGPPSGILVGSIDELDQTPAMLSPAAGSSTGVVAYRVYARARFGLEVGRSRIWDAEPVRVQIELPVGAEGAERIGLERTWALRHGWEQMSREVADRLVLQLTTEF